MAILDEELDNYLADLIPDRDDILTEMEVYADENSFPIVGPQVGQVLFQYTKLLDANRIFECGSGYGYSAMWFAYASSENAEIHCTDGSQDNADMAHRYFERAEVSDKITFHVGMALDVLSELEGEFDIIYNDANKEGYPEIYQATIPRLRQGGLLISDNTLWSARVLNDDPDEATRGILEYNQLSFNDDRVRTMILPIRDGVSVSLKL